MIIASDVSSATDVAILTLIALGAVSARYAIARFLETQFSGGQTPKLADVLLWIFAFALVLVALVTLADS
jgi:hypothetical protein